MGPTSLFAQQTVPHRLGLPAWMSQAGTLPAIEIALSTSVLVPDYAGPLLDVRRPSDSRGACRCKHAQAQAPPAPCPRLGAARSRDRCLDAHGWDPPGHLGRVGDGQPAGASVVQPTGGWDSRVRGRRRFGQRANAVWGRDCDGWQPAPWLVRQPTVPWPTRRHFTLPGYSLPRNLYTFFAIHGLIQGAEGGIVGQGPYEGVGHPLPFITHPKGSLKIDELCWDDPPRETY